MEKGTPHSKLPVVKALIEGTESEPPQVLSVVRVR